MTMTYIQQAVVRHLSGHPFFTGEHGARPIPVIAGNDKSLKSKAEVSMGKLGICVIVYPLGGDFGAQSAAVPYMNPARFNCRVRENMITNRSTGGTQQPADYVAEVCAQLLQHHVPRRLDGEPLGGGGIVLRAIAPDAEEPGIDAWNVVWEYSAGMAHEPVRLDFTSTAATAQP